MTSQAAARWEGPLFLIGMPRSGTKLLRNLLNGHPELRLLPWETEFLPYLVAWVAKNGLPRSESAFEHLWRDVAPAPYFDYRQEARGPFAWRDWRAACEGRFDAASLFEGFARAELGAERGSGTIWGDKSPCYIEHLPLIRRLYPDAKLIHIHRDVRDYCLSLHQSFGKDMRRAAHRWNAGVVGVQRLQAAAVPGLISVRFEDVLTDTEAQLARLCDFIGIGFDHGMLDLDKPVENHGTAKGRKGIVATNFGRYRRELAPRDLIAIEQIAWDGMRAVQYEPERATAPRPLTPAVLNWLKIKDGVSLVVRDVEGRGLLRSAAAYLGDYRIKKNSEARL